MRIVASIESAAALLDAPRIAKASERLVGLMFGSEDFALDLGLPAKREGEAAEMLYARSAIVVAAVSAGKLAIDGIWPDIKDIVGLRADSLRARRLGFSGKTLIHPDHIAVVNETFTPTAEELEHARRVVAAFDDGTARGVGAVALDGQMLDAPVVERRAERSGTARREKVEANEGEYRRSAHRDGDAPRTDSAEHEQLEIRQIADIERRGEAQSEERCMRPHRRVTGETHKRDQEHGDEAEEPDQRDRDATDHRESTGLHRLASSDADAQREVARVMDPRQVEGHERADRRDYRGRTPHRASSGSRTVFSWSYVAAPSIFRSPTKSVGVALTPLASPALRSACTRSA